MMATTSLHPLAADYLDRLDHAARRLPRAERRELVEEIGAHLYEATRHDMSDAEALTVLDRLGEPEEIVAAQRPEELPRRGRPGGQEWAAIALLLIGGFIFVFGWIVGAVLLWTSRAWTTRDKLIGTLIVPGGLASIFLAFAVGGTTRECTSGLGRPTICTPGPSTLHNILAMALVGFCLLGPIFTSVYLARRAR